MLSNLFGGGSKSILGVDIGSHSVRVLELANNNGHYRVEAYAQATLPDDAVVEQSINDPSLVAYAIRSAVEKSNIKTKKVAASLSGSSVISKTVYMPDGLSDEDLDFQIRAEADQYIPYPLEEVALDWEIQNAKPNSGGKIEVLLTACRKENITRLQEAIEQANMDLVVVDVDPFCLERAFELIEPQIKSSDTQTVAIFDIGMNAISMCILHDGKKIYNREQMTGVNMLLEDMARHYGIDSDKAIDLINKGNLPDNFSENVLEPFQESMSEHINRALQFFYSSTPFDKIDHIVLGGHLIEFSKLVRYVQSSLGVPVIRANPFLNMTLSPNVNVELINSESTALMTAVGLALRSDY